MLSAFDVWYSAHVQYGFLCRAGLDRVLPLESSGYGPGCGKRKPRERFNAPGPMAGKSKSVEEIGDADEREYS